MSITTLISFSNLCRIVDKNTLSTRDETMSWSVFMENIGPRVKALRLSKRLNQQELADRCGVSQPAINKIETGKTKAVKGYVLEALARELSSTTGFILYGSESADTLEHDMLMAEMSAIFRDLPLSDKEMLLRMARGILPTTKAERVTNNNHLHN